MQADEVRAFIPAESTIIQRLVYVGGHGYDL